MKKLASTLLQARLAIAIPIGALVMITLGTADAHAEVVRIGGTGMALAAMERIGDQLAAENPNIAIQVLPSLGTSGGIKALAEGAIDVAIAARRASAGERTKGISDGACMQTALVFASSHPKPSDLSRHELPGVYGHPAPTWPDGSPLKIILRSPTGSENPYVADAIPGMGAAFDAAFKRGGIPVGATDQENAQLALRTRGSLTITTLMQIRSENLRLQVVRLDGIEPSAATLADGSYALPVPVCLLLPANPSAGALRLIAYLRSAQRRATLGELGAHPID